MPDYPPATSIAHVYVVARRDLPQPHLSVQIAHAAIAATFAFGEPDAVHPALILCAVSDEAALANALKELRAAGVRCCEFHEEDMGNQMTAFATAPLRGKERQPLRRLELLK